MKPEFLPFEMVSDSFPLTPALSLGERAKRSQLYGKARAESCSIADVSYQSIQRLFPLPEGEGQGEGKGNAYLSSEADLANSFACSSQGSTSCSRAS